MFTIFSAPSSANRRLLDLPERGKTMHRYKRLSMACLYMFYLGLFVFLPTSIALAADAPAAMPASSTKQYLIGLGDDIEVQVWKEPDLTKKLKVRLDGRISLPLAGDLMAAGRSPAELAKDIEEKLSPFLKEPSVAVTLEQSISRRYYVIGQIAKPGEFAIDTPLTILQVIARSGGFLEWAKKDKIVIIRRQNGREEFIPFDYDSLIEGRNISQNIEIAPGDTVVVP